jgi:ribosome-binding protein aMBF1 (putative translation factor)
MIVSYKFSIHISIMSRKIDGGFINYQDFKPVVLTKTKTYNNSNQKSNTNIHIKHKSEFDTNDDNERPTLQYYSSEQISIIKGAREALGLSQKDLAMRISPSLKHDFITNIENGKTQFDKKTFNTICRKLNVKI